MDFHTPELTRIFRAEPDERSRRLVARERSLADRTLAADTIPDLIRDARTVKGSSAFLGFGAIKEAGQRLEKLWRMVGDVWYERRFPTGARCCYSLPLRRRDDSR